MRSRVTGAREERNDDIDTTYPRSPGATPALPRSVEDLGRSYHDPAGLGTTLREVAAQAHRAVRAIDEATRAGGDPALDASDAMAELAALQPRIAQLQRRVEAGTHNRLASYLSALRREVETRLA